MLLAMTAAAVLGAAGLVRPDVVWAPFPGPQTAFLAAGEFEVLYGGAKGPGKTDALVIAPLAQVQHPRFKALLLRETLPQAQEMIDRTHRYYPRLAASMRPAWNGSLRRWTFPDPTSRTRQGGGAIVQFDSLETPDDASKQAGKEWGFVGFDEIGNLADERSWEMLLSEVRAPVPGIRKMARASANPGGIGNAWLKRRFIDPCGVRGERVFIRRVALPLGGFGYLSRRYIPASVLDNPIYANDPLYLAQLMTLPEVLRLQRLYGRWDVGMGTALAELDERVHLVKPFRVPDYWPRYAAFDWGYDHPWACGYYAVNEDGRVFCVDTTAGRRDVPQMIGQKLAERFGPTHPLGADLFHPRFGQIVAGGDVFNEVRAHGENTPSVAEQLAPHLKGIVVRRANQQRIAGLQQLRYYLAWRGLGPEGRDGRPNFVLMDTPGNRLKLAQMQSMIIDPLDVRDVLKVNADTETGQGGDDFYDEVRYAISERPARAIGEFLNQPISAWAPEALAAEIERKYRDTPPSEPVTSGWGNFTG